ncbi:MAG: FtsX-like permease family protein [Promethearchaeota archaeon]
MGVILKIALRNMKRRKTRYILTTITLIIGVALFGGINIVSDSFNAMMLNTIDEQLGTADILVRWDDGDDGWFHPEEIDNLLKNVDNIIDVSYRISGFNVFVSGTDEGNQVENSTYSGVYGLDISNEDEKDLGADPYILDVIDELSSASSIEDLLTYKDAKTGDRVIVITESLQILLNEDITAGSRVRIFPVKGATLGHKQGDTGTWLEYTVTAIIRDNAEAVDFDPETNESSTVSQAGTLLFCDIDNAHELVDGTQNHEGEYNLAVVGVNDIYNVKQVAKDIQDNFSQLKNGEDWKVNDLKTNYLERIDISMETQRTMFLMFGLVALLLSIVLIWNIFNIIREEQEYETGMIQAIGASRSETFRLFLSQGLIMGLLGSGIGTVVSYFISFIIFSITINAMQGIAQSTSGGFSPSSFQIVLLPSTLIMTFTVGLGSCLIGSIYPSYKASRKPLIECLNPIEEKSEREKKPYKKRIIYGLIGIGLIYLGVNSIISPTGTSSGAPAGLVSGMTAPTFILLGIIILTALIVRYLAKGLVKLFGPYLKQTKLLTEKNILRYRKRTILSYSMIALTISYLIGMSVMLESMRAGIGTSIDDTIGSDFRIFTYGTSRSVKFEIASIDGVEDVMGVTSKNARVKIGNEWIGHGTFEEEYNTSISVYAIDTEVMKRHMSTSEIISPSNITLTQMLTELDEGNHIIITEEFADEYGIQVGDVIPVKITLGITYSSLQKMLKGNTKNAKEDTITQYMEVIAIVSKIQGFSTSGGFMGFGGGSVTSYNMFISWNTYERLAVKNLPGGYTDMILRKEADTGNSQLDDIQAGWVNFSRIRNVLNDNENITAYTARMDSYTLSNDNYYTNYQTTVVGIQTKNVNQFYESDVNFGSNLLTEVSEEYEGDTLEELLNTTDLVCVMDEEFAAQQRANGDPDFGIGSTIKLFPLETDPTQLLYRAGATNTTMNLEKGTILSGSVNNLTRSDNVNVLSVSKNGLLIQHVNISFTSLLPSTLSTKIIKTAVLNIETSVNMTIDSLEIQAFNYYGNQFDTIGDVSNCAEFNYTFYFNEERSYIDLLTGKPLQLRIIGNNLNTGSNFNFGIDSLSVNLTQSVYDMKNAGSWPEFKVVGIIATPTLYNTERYFWLSGYEEGADVGGNALYISYDNARSVVYKDYKGKNYWGDRITSVLVHCKDPKSIESVEENLSKNLKNKVHGAWSIVDLKTDALKSRLNIFDWYVWIEDGYVDEDVLDATQDYLQEEGYLVIFGFTKSFMISSFSTMTDLMNFIISGVLLLAILISLIGLALHCLLTTMSRRREIGMLRSIGLTKKGIIRSISGETIIVALLGVLVGIFAGLIQGILTVSAMPTGGFFAFTLSIPWFTIILLLLLTIGAAIISSRYPVRWAANLNIIDAVRTR